MQVFVNLPVADLARARAFWETLGFSFDPRFSDDATALALRLSDHAHAMLLSQARFADFTPRRIADAHATTEVLVALQLDSRDAVADLTARAVAAGGARVRAFEDLGFMVSDAFADPDGHIWEPFWMDPAAQGE